MTASQQPTTDIGNVPAHVFRTIAVMADPIDPDELVTNPTFRMTVEAAYTHGRASLLAEAERLRDELATWRDDVSAQWHAECIRLQGKVDRLTREQWIADIAASSQPEAGAR